MQRNSWLTYCQHLIGFCCCRTDLTDCIQESQAEVGTEVKFVQEKEGYFQFEGWSERWFPEIGTGV